MSGWLGKLKALENHLWQQGRMAWEPNQIREKLQAFGRICNLAERKEEYVFPRGVVGVDGSLYTYGGSYPYQVTLFRAMARHSLNTDGKNAVVIEEVWSPLFMPEGDAALSLADAVNDEEAASAFRMRYLACLEVQAAIAAVERFNPSAILFDGGFFRLEETGDWWKRYQDAASAGGVHTVGVIEEVGTNALVKLLEVPDSMRDMRDRDVLYGVLAPHEVFLPDPSIRLKKKAYYTAFARFSAAPQAVGCDFFADETKLYPLLTFLDQSTPCGSRGIPLWLDIVDAEVRLTRQEAETFLQAALSPSTLEKWFKPMRERRAY